MSEPTYTPAWEIPLSKLRGKRGMVLIRNGKDKDNNQLFEEEKHTIFNGVLSIPLRYTSKSGSTTFTHVLTGLVTPTIKGNSTYCRFVLWLCLAYNWQDYHADTEEPVNKRLWDTHLRQLTWPLLSPASDLSRKLYEVYCGNNENYKNTTNVEFLKIAKTFFRLTGEKWG